MNEPEPAQANLPSLPFRSAAVSGRKKVHFNFRPDAEQRAQIAQALDLIDLPEFTYKGELTPSGRSDVVLHAELAAHVVQPCSVTLAPVHSKLTDQSDRRFVQDYVEPEADELEIPAEDTEAMPEIIDVAAIAIEALALALPLYPRARGAEFGEATFAAPGVAPLTTDSPTPYAGPAGPAAKLKKPDESDV